MMFAFLVFGLMLAAFFGGIYFERRKSAAPTVKPKDDGGPGGAD